MNSTILKNLSITPINQFQKGDFDKGVYFGIWSFGDIIPSIKFTHREPLNFDLFKDNIALKKKYPEFDSDYYQRLINDERTKKVIQFIIKEIITYHDNNKETLITFPTSLILSLYLSESENFDDYKEELKLIDSSQFFEGNIGVFYDKVIRQIYLPDKNIMLVVDGQHRLAGMYALYNAILDLTGGTTRSVQVNRTLIDFAQKSLIKLELLDSDLMSLKSLIEQFQFSCTILLDYDVWEQGKVFADVNFNQKPVNKSLYYDIFGSFPDPEKNDIYLAHNWTVLLNSSPDSALYKKVKLLGTGEGFFSQAFFVEALLPFLRKNGIWGKVVTDFITTNQMNESIPKFLKSYFNAISELFSNFAPSVNSRATTYKDNLFKTTGLGALIKLIPFIYKNLEEQLYKTEDELKDQIKSFFKNELTAPKVLDRILSYRVVQSKELEKYRIENNIEKIQQTSRQIEQLNKDEANISSRLSGQYYFSQDGIFAKGGSKGLQDKLYKELAFDLGFLKAK